MEHIGTVLSRWQINLTIQEEGDIYFFYKVRKGVTTPRGLQDISRLFLVLDPQGQGELKTIVIGKKRLPLLRDGGESAWGYIEKVGGRGYAVNRRGHERSNPQGSRAAGEGIYAIVTHTDHTHFLYQLEFPKRLGDVQRTFEIGRRAGYLLLAKHYFAAPAAQPLPPGYLARRPGRFVPAAPRDLREEGKELLLVGATEQSRHLGIETQPEHREPSDADIFRTLALSRRRHSTVPLEKGTWE